MLSIKFKVRLSLFMSMLILSTGTAMAEILSPPTKIPFAKDVIVKKFSSGQPLEFFEFTGKWEVNKVSNKLALVGTSGESSTYLLSIDKLTKKPKTFKFDFLINNIGNEYGFIYGDKGVIVINDMMYPAEFDEKNSMLKISSSVGTINSNIRKRNYNTLEINTGYEMTGEQGCIIYINGIGIELKYANRDTPFGVYLGSQSHITINNIRWGIGSK